MKASASCRNNPESAKLTLQDVLHAIEQLLDWNENVTNVDFYYESQFGMQLLAANCTLITAIGEGINRVNRQTPNFLQNNFPDIPWHAYVSMRNHIAHGYFEIDADLIFDAIQNDFPILRETINNALQII
ncbi:MAG: DUF86 domain-containing protein [Muribaculaceae bacterium]|nr:DUF86 domain-containing protein [Muribaculaceae bacterium]